MMEAASMLELVEEYVVHRRTLGFELRSEGWQLRAFARFADAVGHAGAITLDLAVRWATAPPRVGRQFPGRRLEVLRPFARYRAALDGMSEIPPRFLLGPPRRRPVLHLYSEEQIVALVGAAAMLGPRDELRPQTAATLFGLLAACGLRVSEALRLDRSDVDLERGVLLIRSTKFRKSRMVPLHPTTTEALRGYATERNHRIPHPEAPTFFVRDTGAPVRYSTIRAVFRRLCDSLGWTQLQPRPRIHDLRHAFARRRLRDWYAQGLDVAPRLAALATYLGHAHITDTHWYLAATPDLLSLAADRFETFAADRRVGGTS